MSGRNLALRGWFAMLLASSSAATIEVPTGTEDFTLSIEPLIQPRIQVELGRTTRQCGSKRPREYGLLHPACAAALAGNRLSALLVRNQHRRASHRGARQSERDALPARRCRRICARAGRPLRNGAASHAALACCGRGSEYGSSIEGVGNILLYNNARQSREIGIQLRALLLGQRVLLRGGFYEGARNANPPGTVALNPNGIPLAGGML